MGVLLNYVGVFGVIAACTAILTHMEVAQMHDHQRCGDTCWLEKRVFCIAIFS